MNWRETTEGNGLWPAVARQRATSEWGKELEAAQNADIESFLSHARSIGRALTTKAILPQLTLNGTYATPDWVKALCLAAGPSAGIHHPDTKVTIEGWPLAYAESARNPDHGRVLLLTTEKIGEEEIAVAALSCSIESCAKTTVLHRNGAPVPGREAILTQTTRIPGSERRPLNFWHVYPYTGDSENWQEQLHASLADLADYYHLPVKETLHP